MLKTQVPIPQGLRGQPSPLQAPGTLQVENRRCPGAVLPVLVQGMSLPVLQAPSAYQKCFNLDLHEPNSYFLMVYPGLETVPALNNYEHLMFTCTTLGKAGHFDLKNNYFLAVLAMYP